MFTTTIVQRQLQLQQLSWVNASCCCCLQPVLGKLVQRPATLDKALISELMNSRRPDQDDFDVIAAGTMCALDFYEGLTSLSILILLLLLLLLMLLLLLLLLLYKGKDQ